ncbi:MAG TPA: hypothetical protein VGJ20_20525 [Xanthobacteraceae bacterium]|jgi:hypothetical protein
MTEAEAWAKTARANFDAGLQNGVELGQRTADLIATMPDPGQIVKLVRKAYDLDPRELIHDASYKQGFMEGCYCIAIVLKAKLEDLKGDGS